MDIFDKIYGKIVLLFSENDNAIGHLSYEDEVFLFIISDQIAHDFNNSIKVGYLVEFYGICYIDFFFVEKFILISKDEGHGTYVYEKTYDTSDFELGR